MHVNVQYVLDVRAGFEYEKTHAGGCEHVRVTEISPDGSCRSRKRGLDLVANVPQPTEGKEHRKEGLNSIR